MLRLAPLHEPQGFHALDGTLKNAVQLPGPGSAGGFGGERGDTFVFYTFTSFDVPPTGCPAVSGPRAAGFRTLYRPARSSR